MTEIITITLNPAVDVSTAVDHVQPGPKLRCDVPGFDPGGGGINVSRAIRHLGGDSLAFVAFGGVTGQRLRTLLDAEEVRVAGFVAPGETRQSLAVTDRSTGGQFRFVMPGPEWTPAIVSDVLNAIEVNLTANGIVVISGSPPPGVPDDFIARLSRRLNGREAQLIADTSGRSLQQLVDHPVGITILRMDSREAADLAGHELPTREQTAAFARTLVDKGVAQTVVIARGVDGSTLVSKAETLHCARPIVEVVSAVGAGDSFVGAFTLSLARDGSLSDALRHGTAAASAAVLTQATQLCTRQDAERLLMDCELTPL